MRRRRHGRGRHLRGNGVSTNATNRVFGWKYVVFAFLSGLAAIFVTWIEYEWIRARSKSPPMYLPVALSLVASCGLIGGVFALWIRTRQSLQIETISSVCIAVCVLAFLVEIQPIAAGNNESGEVFPLVFLPGLWVVAHAILSRRRLKELSKSEVTQWLH